MFNFTRGVGYQLGDSLQKTLPDNYDYEFKEPYPEILKEIEKAYIEINKSKSDKKVQYRFILKSNKEVCIHPEKTSNRFLFKECLPEYKRLMELSFLPIFILNKNAELIWDPKNKKEKIMVYNWIYSNEAIQVYPRYKIEDKESIKIYTYEDRDLKLENEFIEDNKKKKGNYPYLRKSGKFQRKGNQLLIPFEAIFYLKHEEKTISFFLYKKNDLKVFKKEVKPFLEEIYSNISNNYKYTMEYYSTKRVKIERKSYWNYLYFIPTVIWTGLLIPAFGLDVVVSPLVFTSCIPFMYSPTQPNRCYGKSFAP